MKLYYFNPNDYAEEYFVVADSEESAIKSLNKHLSNHSWHALRSNKWGDLIFRNYTIDVYEPGEVAETERS